MSESPLTSRPAPMGDEIGVLQRLQRTELDILLVFATFCKEHGIRWFMDSGTVLGAVRHGGFIPWDDDIDVGMLRGDYEQFLEFARTSFPTGYTVRTSSDTSGFAGMFAKVYRDGTRFETAETRDAGLEQGIFIDVFPWDPLDERPRESVRQRRRARFWQSASYLYHSAHVTLPRMNRTLHAMARFATWLAHHAVRLLFNPRAIRSRFERSIQTDRPGHLYIPFAWPMIDGVPIEVLMPTSSLLFEGVELPAPADPIAYLEIMYGDWRTLPPEDQRRTHLPLLIDFADGTQAWAAGSSSVSREGV